MGHDDSDRCVVEVSLVNEASGHHTVSIPRLGLIGRITGFNDRPFKLYLIHDWVRLTHIEYNHVVEVTGRKIKLLNVTRRLTR